MAGVSSPSDRVPFCPRCRPGSRHRKARGGRGILPLYPERSCRLGLQRLRSRFSFQFGSVRGRIVGSSWKVPMIVWNSATPATSGSKPRFHDGVFQRIRDGHPDPIAYLWRTMSDGQFQIGKPNRPPTFVWRIPITKRRHQLIYEYMMQRKYDQFGVRTNNCTDMVTEAAALAGINLIHRIRLTLPPETKVWGRTVRVWTDPQYRILEYSTPDVLDADLRQLARLGIGSDVTEWYLNLKW
jgi:hypothetical protein